MVVDILTLDGEFYAGTVTPVEARKMIFESALGLDQTNLASIAIGINRGWIVTFKLRKQIDLDDLYDRENFEFERRSGENVQVIACRIRGVRNHALRSATRKQMATSSMESPRQAEDDGTRTVRILGCEYLLSETEILNWLS